MPPRPRSDEPRKRGWIFTFFALNGEELSKDVRPVFEGSTYSISGWELTKTGRRHWQSYCYYDTLKSASQMRAMHPGVHCQAAKAGPHANFKYCSKGAIYFETGERPSQGKRTDLTYVAEMLRNGASPAQIDAVHPSHVLRLSHKFQGYRDLVVPPNGTRPVTVHVYYGATGTGKTRRVLATEPEVFWVPFWEGKKVWLDGYTGQEAICLDDFDGSMDFRLLLHMTDIYSRRWQVKGSFVISRWLRVYITSDQHPRSWYSGVKNWPQLKRRISQIWSFQEDIVQLELDPEG